jgi:LysR family nitrogen assimilation transcriptional regulator
MRAEIDSVDSIRELVGRGRWATIMPVSVFRDTAQDESVVMSEISGVQLNRLLVLATRVDPRPNPSLSLVHELVVAEFSRMERMGIFSFGARADAPSTRAQAARRRR